MSYALITGASSGIGKEFAYTFASHNYDLVLVSRSEDKLLQIKHEIESKYGCCVVCLSRDLSNSESVKEVYDYCVKNHIDVECLVNNVGVGDFGDFVSCDWNRQLEIIQLNIISLMHLTHLFLPNMIKNRCGRILNVSSTAWLCSGPKMACYYASKAFVTRFSCALRQEVSKYNIFVTTLCPPSVKTNFQVSSCMKRKKERYAITAKEVADKGYQGLMKNRGIVYCDMQSVVLNLLVRILPDSVCSRVIQYINQ